MNNSEKVEEKQKISEEEKNKILKCIEDEINAEMIGWDERYRTRLAESKDPERIKRNRELFYANSNQIINS